MQEILRSLLSIAALVGIAVLSLVGRSFADEKQTQANDQPTLDWQIESSHTILATADSAFFARIRVKAASVESQRQPLNLVLVFDRSGSMKEDAKIGYLRQAGHLVVDNLARQDHLALVAYNHQVQTLVPLHAVVNREYVHHRIDELFAEGAW